MRFPDDPECVVALLDESERLTWLGNQWAASKNNNPVSAQLCFRKCWAYALAAAWLRS